MKQWAEAIESYQMIIKQFPDDQLAADAQFKLAQCYEESGEFNQALEAYVTLAATYPKNPLIANVMVRISEHFYKAENYKVAAQVGEKFLEHFEGHKWAPKMAFRVGQCYYKDKQYTKAAETFERSPSSSMTTQLGVRRVVLVGRELPDGEQHEGVRSSSTTSASWTIRPRKRPNTRVAGSPCPRCCANLRRRPTRTTNRHDAGSPSCPPLPVLRERGWG